MLRSFFMCWALLRVASSLTFLPAALPSEEGGVIRGQATACDTTDKCNAAATPAEVSWMIGKWKTNAGNQHCTSGHKNYCIQSPTEWDDVSWYGAAPICPGASRCNGCASGYTCIAKDDIGNGNLCTSGKKALCVDRSTGSTRKTTMTMFGTANRADALELCRLHGHTLPYVRNEKQHEKLLGNCKQAIEMHGLPADSLCHTAMAHTAEGLVYHDGMVHSEHFEFHNYATHDGKPVEENLEPNAGRVVVVNAETGNWETVSEETHAVVLCNNNGVAWRRILFGNAMYCGDDLSVFDAKTFVLTPPRMQDLEDATKDELIARDINFPYKEFAVEGAAINVTAEAAVFGYQDNEYGIVWDILYAAEPLARQALAAVNETGFGQGVYDRLDSSLFPTGCSMRDVVIDPQLVAVGKGNGNRAVKGAVRDILD